MDDSYIDYDFLMKVIVDKVINDNDYPLDFDLISNYLLELDYGNRKIIDTVQKGDKCYISSKSQNILDTLIERCNELYKSSKEDFEQVVDDPEITEEERVFFHEEILKWEQLINILSTMKEKEFSPPKLGKYVFVALPRTDKKGSGISCSLDDSNLFDGNVINSTLGNLSNMESLITGCMDSKGIIVTRQKGSGLHRVDNHVMYKNVVNNQRILFKQCKDNMNVFFILVVNAGREVHGNGLADDARMTQYNDLTKELNKYLDRFTNKDGVVEFTEEQLTELADLYDNYKASLANRSIKDKSSSTVNALFDLANRISKKAKEKEMKAGGQYE